MKPSAVAVALLVVLSGCNAFGVGDGGDGDAATVTPVPVPDATRAGTPASGSEECLVPRPATPSDRVPATPDEPVVLPREGGVVNGSALVALHGRALANYSYHMRVGANTDVWAMPGAAAFTYQGVELGLGSPWAYAVGGTLYTLRSDVSRLVLTKRPYRVGSPVHRRYAVVLRGERWLAQRLHWHNYTVVGTRTWNGTTVRVLEDTQDDPERIAPETSMHGWLFVNSTVYVDRRGIVRYVRHVRHVRYSLDRPGPNRTEVGRLVVDQVGTARLHRPEVFCVASPERVLTPTVGSPAGTPTSSGNSSGAAPVFNSSGRRVTAATPGSGIELDPGHRNDTVRTTLRSSPRNGTATPGG